MSSRGTIKWWYIKLFGKYLFEIHIYDETTKHIKNCVFAARVEISSFNRELLNFPLWYRYDNE